MIHLCVLTQEGVWISKLALFDSHPGEPHSLSLLYTMFWLLFCKDINEFPRSKPALSQHSLTYINKICCSNCEIICIHNYSGFSHKLQSCPRKHIKIEIHYLCFIVQNGLLFYQAAMIKKILYSKQETWNIILWQGGDRSKSRIAQLSLKKELGPLKSLSL